MTPTRQPTRTFRRRVGVSAAALAVAVGGVTLAAGPAIAGTVPSTTLTLDFPTSIGNGGDLQAAQATIHNTGSTIPSARIDFDITPNTGTGDLAPSDFVIEYEVPGTGTYMPLPTTQDSSGHGVSGVYGPATGYPIAAGDTTAHFLIATNPGAPTGGITVTANLDPVPTAASLATDTAGVTLKVPTLSFTGFPTSLTPGAAPTTFTGTLTNQTGSDYGGSTPSNSPSPAGVRLDFTLVSSTANPAGDLTLQYCQGGTSTACTGGTWTTIPLNDNGSGTYTGFYGPTGGFALPNGTTNTTPFRISAAAGTATTTVITHVAIDKVDSTGSTAGTDSTGVDNGTITTVSAGTTAIGIKTTTTHLSLSKNPAQQGDTVTATASVTPATASGTVQFSVDGTNVGSPVALSAGSASATLPTTLTVGDHTVTATYNGDTSDTTSTATVTLTITAASTTVTDPGITPHLSSAQGPHHRWYRTPVTITYTCTPGSAPLDSAGCPGPVTLSGNGGHFITRTVTATDGGSATVTSVVAIDHAKPHVRVTGATSGRTYRHHRQLHAACRDHLSGIAKCTVHSHHGPHHTIHYVAVARDKAGNTAHRHGHYTIKRHHS